MVKEEIPLSKFEKVMNRVQEHFEEALEHFPEDRIVGIFLQGSQNYGLDTEESDVDTKLILTPSFEDLAMNAKPISTTHVRENEEHIDFKDIRLYIDCFRKQNLNFLEILFTDYAIINPLYAEEWKRLVDAREEISHMNPYKSMQSMAGMCREKFHALQHRYPAKQHIIDEHGYDGKQVSHQERVRHAMIKYANGESYWSCIHEPFEPYYLKMMKRHVLPLEEAKAMSAWSLEEAKVLRTQFCDAHPNEENEETLALLKKIQCDIMETSVKEELIY